MPRFEAANAHVLSISVDTIYSHAAYAEKLGGITFPMLSDFHPKGRVAQLFGTYNEQYGRNWRSIFLMDTSGVIRWKKIYQSGIPVNEDLLAELNNMA
ncbi:MAG: redoxin domain-containing protein [Chloroflexi bacterium]|nr:redoxin domain-containing protein [Chloroflexota bacterium]